MLPTAENLAKKMRMLRDHGMSKERRYYHEVVGFNYRMTNLQAAIGTAQAERIEDILIWRNELETQYRKVFSEMSGVTLQRRDLPDRKKISWLVSVLVSEDKRDQALSALKEQEIDARAFFVPMSDMDIYKSYARTCTVSKKIAGMGVNLPTTYEVKMEEIEKIASVLKRVL